MLLSSLPAKLVAAFANSGNKNTIPAASQIAVTPGAASLADGFPPLTATPLAAGGVPPSVGDMNGILNAVSAWAVWQAAGGTVQYDSAFSSSITGYPNKAVLASSTTPGLLWMNTVDGNTTNPDSGGSNWLPIRTGGFLSSVAAKSSSYTIASTDDGVLIEAAAIAITLPSSPATGFRAIVLSTATGTTILPNGNTVNLASGATSSTISLPTTGDYVVLVWDGSVWRQVGGSVAMSGGVAAGVTNRKKLITTTTTWTAPTGVTTVYVKGSGGGGGGGYGGAATTGGSGGGAAQAVNDYALPVSPGTAYTSTPGAGGAGGTSGSAPGAGVASTFGALLTLSGGGAGANSSTTGGAAGGSGGNAGGGGVFSSGSISFGGAGGSGLFGTGGVGGCASAAGNAGAGYGAGGGGGGGNYSGGAGSPGFFEVEW